MIGALDSSYTFNPLVNTSSGDAAQTSSATPSQEISDTPPAANDSVSIEEDGDEKESGSKPNLGWLNETDDAGDDSSMLIARETGKGPENTKATWNDPVKYREKIFEKKITDPFLQKAFDGAKGVMDEEFRNYKKNDKGWNCYGWRDKFLTIKADKNGERVNTVNAAMMDKLSDGVEKKTGQRPTSITPYYQTLPNPDYPNAQGHTYVYLQMKFDNGKEQWIFTEANASLIPSLGDGCVHYQTKAVNKPDNITTSPSQNQQQNPQQSKIQA